MVAIDRISRRYGYSDEHVMSIPYARFKELSQLTAELEQEEVKMQFKQHSLVAWKVTEKIKEIFANKDTKFITLPEFWEQHGFGDGSTKKDEVEVNTVEEAIDYIDQLFANSKGTDFNT